MKLDRLTKVLAERSKTKVYVLAEQFCLCGYASSPRASGARVSVRIGASVRVVFATRELIHEPESSGTLILTAAHKVTKRVQTHRRHLAGRAVPAEYFERAKAL